MAAELELALEAREMGEPCLVSVWALTMQIVGSFTPNSAAAERVFSMLKLMFGDTQMKALMDMIQAALMLKYNQRKVG